MVFDGYLSITERNINVFENKTLTIIFNGFVPSISSTVEPRYDKGLRTKPVL